MAIYFALLLALPRRRLAEEIMLSPEVSAADIRNATLALEAAARRLRVATETALEDDRSAIGGMAEHLHSIRDKIQDDPRDFRGARPFIAVCLPKIVDAVEAYVDLARRARGANRDRLAELGKRIHGFGPAIERIDPVLGNRTVRGLSVPTIN